MDTPAELDRSVLHTAVYLHPGKRAATSFSEGPATKKGGGERHNLVRENALLILGMGLSYLDFVDACSNGMSGRIGQCIRCFAISYQGAVATKYAAEMLHIVACVQKYWKKEFKYISIRLEHVCRF